MSILPPAVLTATQLVGGLVAAAKNARDLAKDSSNHDLKAAISDLYDSLLDVKGRVLDLDEENRVLKAAVAEKGKYIGPIAPHGYYFQADNQADPLCPKCFQSTPRTIAFLKSPYYDDDGKFQRQCQLCRHLYYDNGKGLRGPNG